QGFQVLHIHRADDVDASVQNLDDVLPPLSVTGPGYVRVCQLIDERDFWSAANDCLDVHLLERYTAVFDASSRYDLESIDQRRRFGPAVCLDEAYDDVDSATL